MEQQTPRTICILAIVTNCSLWKKASCTCSSQQKNQSQKVNAILVSFLRILIVFTWRVIYLLLHKFVSLFFISCNKNIVHFWKAIDVFFIPSCFFLEVHASLKGFQESLVNFCPMKNSRECDWKTDVWVTVTQNLRTMGLDNHLLVCMCTYFNLEVWTLRQTFFLKDLEEGFLFLI